MLDVGEDDHGAKVGDCRYGKNGGLEVGLGPGIASEARCEVRRRSEEHIPV